MKKFLTGLMMVAALAVAVTANAETIERDSDGELQINVFANIIESFRVSITGDDLQIAGAAPQEVGFVDLNGGLSGFDGLKSILAADCRDDADTSPTYAGNASCSVDVGPLSSSSDSKLMFDFSLDVLVEISGPGNVDLDIAMSGVSGADAVFDNTAVDLDGSASQAGLVDQAALTLNWSGEAPLNGGPGYDDTIVVTVTKN